MGPPHTLKMTRQLTLRLLAVIFAANVNAAPSKCVLPAVWRGAWFHSGMATVNIDETTVSSKGTCLENDRDRYLFHDKFHQCFRCLVIHEKHMNVLQYKETFCDGTRSLEYVCSLLTGDAQLHSMFRLGAAPVPCPFPHTYTFTYNRGQAECTYPLSTVDSCTEDWRMLFRYQACPDIQGTESTIEEFMCLAAWKEGSNRYLVGKTDHQRATSDEDRYRCFVYDSWNNRSHSGFMVAQSGDATCNGLFSIISGSRTLILTKVDTSGSKCRFPSWVGGPHWHSLDGHITLHVTRKNSTLRLTGHISHGPVTHACLEPYAHTKRSATYVTRVIYRCTSGYQCVHMLARDDHVLEILMGKPVPVRTACDPPHFDLTSTNYTTFVSGNAESRQCPGMGRYKVTHNSESQGGSSDGANVAASTSNSGGGSGTNGNGAGAVALGGGGGGGGGGGSSSSSSSSSGSIGSASGGSQLSGDQSECDGARYTALIVGCSDTSTLEIHDTCSYSEYSCHGYWEEAGRQYLVVTPISRSSKGVRRLCLVLDRGAGVLSLASSAHSCSRHLTPGFHGHIALNTTSVGGCGQLSPASASSVLQRVSVPLIWAVTLMSLVQCVDARLWTF
ncbi:uncharacterized protein [Macrobrachium rosenbergii]|uniref:uncharacterized protein isoform X2 n=1 Tax=Macrobrachium rosenbergii TaxID=79674 RepID=UPI0034D5DB24